MRGLQSGHAPAPFIALLVATTVGMTGCNQHPIAGPILVVEPSAASKHLIGQFSQSEGALVSKIGEAGYLHFGPYAELAPGAYEAKFVVSMDGAAGGTTTLDVNAFVPDKADSPVAAAQLTNSGSDQSISVPFTAVAGARYEFRVFCDGKANVKLHKITLLKR